MIEVCSIIERQDDYNLSITENIFEFEKIINRFLRDIGLKLLYCLLFFRQRRKATNMLIALDIAIKVSIHLSLTNNHQSTAFSFFFF